MNFHMNRWSVCCWTDVYGTELNDSYPNVQFSMVLDTCCYVFQTAGGGAAWQVPRLRHHDFHRAVSHQLSVYSYMILTAYCRCVFCVLLCPCPVQWCRVCTTTRFVLRLLFKFTVVVLHFPFFAMQQKWKFVTVLARDEMRPEISHDLWCGFYSPIVNRYMCIN